MSLLFEKGEGTGSHSVQIISKPVYSGPFDHSNRCKIEKNMEWDFTPRSCASPPNIWDASSVSLPERLSITGFAKHWSARLPSFCQTRTPACRRFPTNCTSPTRPSCPRCSNASRVSLRQSTETRLPEGGPSCPRRTACADPEGRQTPRRFSSFILRNW